MLSARKHSHSSLPGGSGAAKWKQEVTDDLHVHICKVELEPPAGEGQGRAARAAPRITPSTVSLSSPLSRGPRGSGESSSCGQRQRVLSGEAEINNPCEPSLGSTPGPQDERSPVLSQPRLGRGGDSPPVTTEAREIPAGTPRPQAKAPAAHNSNPSLLWLPEHPGLPPLTETSQSPGCRAPQTC